MNLDPQLRCEIQQSLLAPTKATFNDAQRKIQGLLESDSYVRFLQSDLYIDLLRSEQERKKDENTEKMMKSKAIMRKHETDHVQESEQHKTEHPESSSSLSNNNNNNNQHQHELTKAASTTAMNKSTNNDGDNNNSQQLS